MKPKELREQRMEELLDAAEVIGATYPMTEAGAFILIRAAYMRGYIDAANKRILAEEAEAVAARNGAEVR